LAKFANSCPCNFSLFCTSLYRNIVFMADTLKGADRIEANLNGFRTAFLAAAAPVVTDIMTIVLKYWGQYPPQPDRWRSGRYNNWVRGIGRVPMRTIEAAKGDVKKMVLKGVPRTSEDLGSKFQIVIHTATDSVEGSISNSASYGGYVIGPKEGDPHQSPWHAVTGWRRQDDAQEFAQEIVRIKKQEFVDSLVNSFGKG
jgi:hypothetical protein